jgi:hypothetical protein
MVELLQLIVEQALLFLAVTLPFTPLSHCQALSGELLGPEGSFIFLALPWPRRRLLPSRP